MSVFRYLGHSKNLIREGEQKKQLLGFYYANILSEDDKFGITEIINESV
jgi:predicted ATPase